jgi:hypothetical protein
VSDRSFRLNLCLVSIAALIVFSSACSSNSVVSDSSSRPAGSTAAPATAAQSAPTPQPSAEAPSTPTPTPHPAIKQAAAQPGVPVAVPDSVKRPLTADEMQKALQQLPPEVRQRIMGMQQVPTPSPQPTKK